MYHFLFEQGQSDAVRLNTLSSPKPLRSIVVHKPLDLKELTFNNFSLQIREQHSSITHSAVEMTIKVHREIYICFRFWFWGPTGSDVFIQPIKRLVIRLISYTECFSVGLDKTLHLSRTRVEWRPQNRSVSPVRSPQPPAPVSPAPSVCHDPGVVSDPVPPGQSGSPGVYPDEEAQRRSGRRRGPPPSSQTHWSSLSAWQHTSLPSALVWPVPVDSELTGLAC